MTHRPPAYCRQREKNRADRAFVRINGRKIKLGVYGSDESRDKYAKVIARYRGDGHESDRDRPPAATPPTVSEVLAAFLPHIERHYGYKSTEWYHYRQTMRGLRRIAGSLPAGEFKSKKLKELRKYWVAQGWSRGYVNKHIARVKRIFKWAVSEQLVPPDLLQILASVEGLRAGKTEAHDNSPVPPVAIGVVDATIEKLPAVVTDMVRVQLLTGIRPGELVRIRPCDIDRSGDVWVYRPPQHKTKHKGKKRAVAIGPKAQAILLRYLARAADTCCFQPRDSEAKRLADREANRKTPLSVGNRRGTHRKADPKRSPGSAYSVDSYRRAIQRAAKRAGVERWAPHQLRHTRGTDVRRDFGLDSAQAVLGHSTAKTTEIYAEIEFEKAAEVARRTG